jgi:hypothetical protein
LAYILRPALPKRLLDRLLLLRADLQADPEPKALDNAAFSMPRRIGS